MDRCITNINKIFLDILKRDKLISDLQFSLFKLIESTLETDFFSLIIAEGIIENEQIIDIFYTNQIFPLLNASENTVKIYDYSKIKQYVKQGYFIYENEKKDKMLAIHDIAYLKQLRAIYSMQIILVKKQDFYQILEQNFSHLNIIRAGCLLQFITKNIGAKNINYPKVMMIFFVIYFGSFLTFKYFFHTINILGYFSQNILKFILFIRAIFSHPPPLSVHFLSNWHVKQNSSEENCNPLRANVWEFIKSQDINDLALPIYTILLPLYKEANKLQSLLYYIASIDYPKHKLDVKIIIEADDDSMVYETILHTLPSYMHLIKVPFSLPRTKPKALNYVMQYCKGQYVVVYDAEDRPEPDQLLKAVREFRKLPEEYACLQAKLSFYNENENLLTKFFSMEYCLWFEYLLKGLSLMNLPVTLGGTSNHFKLDILQKVGFWDAYNVTEDAELGIRLSSFNYKVCIIDSYTFEESPRDIINWINQRSRWIKGFLQTFLVFLSQHDKYKKYKLSHIIVIWIFVGFSSYGFCCLPFLIIIIKINQFTIIHYLWIINSFFAFSYLYGTAFFLLLYKNGKINNFKILDIKALFLWPLYFLLHVIASYKAIWEIIFVPFKWNKTKHGK